MSDFEAIEFYNRYTGRVEQEQVYGAAWLRWTYVNPFGRLALELVAKRAFFSRWYGWRMDRPASREKVRPFIEQFHVDESEFAVPSNSYATFNEFFYRKLKPSARPVDEGSDSAVFPADGRHLGFQDVSKAAGIFVKGQRFDILGFLGDETLARRYSDGTLILSRLCPVDYHRYHFPIGGTPTAARLIEGPLYSVNPIALRRKVAYLWENRRMITEVESERFGKVLCVEIGATNVGSMVQTYSPGMPVSKGAEKGYFKFGGSSTITLFERGRIRLCDDLVEHTEQCRELYARVGDRMGLAG